MKIGVISDTHDKLLNIDAALRFFNDKQVSLVIHCGDWKSLSTIEYFVDLAAGYEIDIVGVLGNNDKDMFDFLKYASLVPGNFTLKEGIFELEIGNKKVVIYHGHHTPTLRQVRARSDYAILCLGHTHKPKIEYIEDRVIVNPGSTAFAIPRSKEWKPTVVIVDTESMQATLFEL